jgi:Peptidase S46
MNHVLKLTVFVLLSSVNALSEEGKWTPGQVLQQGEGWVKRQGFRVPLSRLWDAKTNSGLLSNAVQLPGCSGSFVSPQGLLITNHHCVLDVLQEHSTPQENLTLNGFLAKTPQDEKASKAFRIQVPKQFDDVTAKVLAAIPAGADDLARFRAVERAQKTLVAECEKAPHTRCQFAAFESGLFYTLTAFEEISDVRLVYAPPESVGDFGGEVDNWTWPRHSGDFSLVRAYVDGKPYASKHFFPLSVDGVKPGDAVAVLGYPGRSFRALLASEMADRESQYYPHLASYTLELIQILEEEAKKSEAAQIAVSDDLRGLLNTHKNALGQLAGLKRGKLLEKRKTAEAASEAFARMKSATEALAAKEELEKIVQERRASWERDFLTDTLSQGARALAWPLQIALRATEREKPDLEREPGMMERNQARLVEQFDRDFSRYVAAADKRLAAVWFRRALALPTGRRFAAVDALFRADAGVKPDEVLQRLYQRSQVFDAAVRKTMYGETVEQLHRRNDVLIELGFELLRERNALKERRDRWAGAGYRLFPLWRKLVLAQAQRPVAPDANGTLRVTFGRVRGYAPKDAVEYGPQTTLKGMLEKETGVVPFLVADKVKAAALAKRPSAYLDTRLKDVPIDFLSDADTTGGNSGSPTIDANGKLVGVNFDRVWENVANDFGYNPDIARNVNADARYLLWLLEQVEGGAAQPLLRELTQGVAQ